MVFALFLCVQMPQTIVLSHPQHLQAPRGCVREAAAKGVEEGRNQTKASTASAWAWEERDPKAATVREGAVAFAIPWSSCVQL